MENREKLHKKLWLLRLLSRIENIAWILGIGNFLILIFYPNKVSDQVLWIFIPVMGISTLVNVFMYCPRCRKPFYGPVVFFGNTLRWSCHHCGLLRSGKNA